jgi:ribosomal protein L24
VANSSNSRQQDQWSEGDLVQILIGQHRGHVGRIYEIWPSRKQVRVEVTEQMAEDVTDVYFYNEVCRQRESTAIL